MAGVVELYAYKPNSVSRHKRDDDYLSAPIVACRDQAALSVITWTFDVQVDVGCRTS